MIAKDTPGQRNNSDLEMIRLHGSQLERSMAGIISRHESQISKLRQALLLTLGALENQKAADDGYSVHDDIINDLRAVLAKGK